MSEPVHRGKCFCGAVRIEANGAPAVAGYCHCQDCRDWSGAPVTAFVMWPFAAVEIAAGGDLIARFARDPATPRVTCARCGGNIGAFRDAHAWPHAAFSPYFFADLEFVPTLHVFCRDAVIDVADALPRYAELPERLGGMEFTAPAAEGR